MGKRKLVKVRGTGIILTGSSGAYGVTIGGAALDVFEKEPLDKDSILWDCPGLILTTHVAGNWTEPFLK